MQSFPLRDHSQPAVAKQSRGNCTPWIPAAMQGLLMLCTFLQVWNTPAKEQVQGVRWRMRCGTTATAWSEESRAPVSPVTQTHTLTGPWSWWVALQRPSSSSRLPAHTFSSDWQGCSANCALHKRILSENAIRTLLKWKQSNRANGDKEMVKGAHFASRGSRLHALPAWHCWATKAGFPWQTSACLPRGNGSLCAHVQAAGRAVTLSPGSWDTSRTWGALQTNNTWECVWGGVCKTGGEKKGEYEKPDI